MRKLRNYLILFLLLIVSSAYPQSTALAQETKAAPIRVKSNHLAKVFIIEPKNGAVVTSPFQVKFGAKNINIVPAGQMDENTGHHHLLINQESLPPFDQVLPATDKILHFGKAQIETELNLPAGEYTLQLLLAGGNHIPNDPPVYSKKIKIKVK